MRIGQILDRASDHWGRYLALAGGILVALIVAPNLAQPTEPDPYTSAETEDLDGDGTEETVMAAPGGVEQSPDPGEVYVLSGADGSVLVTLQGSSDGDWFGYSVAVAGDVDQNNFKDLIIGAPKEGNGRVYVFYGPFNGTGPLVITANQADMTLLSTDPDDYDFGDAVAPVSDFTGDGIPDFRIRAWFVDAGGFEESHTYLLDGATGQSLFRVTGDEPFDPWAYVEGDVDGDGDVDQDDLDIILDNDGLTAEDLTTFDGDVNGDGIVNSNDFDIAADAIGFDLFDPLTELATSCYVCPSLCPDPLPSNLEDICDLTCYGICHVPVMSPANPLVDVSLETFTIIGANGWEVLAGADLIKIVEDPAHTWFEFRPLSLGLLRLRATLTICGNSCMAEDEYYIVQPLPGDSDGDGAPDECEQDQLSSDPFNPFSPGPDSDADNDGLLDFEECQYGTNFGFFDTDGDGLADQCELDRGRFRPRWRRDHRRGEPLRVPTASVVPRNQSGLAEFTDRNGARGQPGCRGTQGCRHVFVHTQRRIARHTCAIRQRSG